MHFLSSFIQNVLCCCQSHDTDTRVPKISKTRSARGTPTSIPLPASKVPEASSTVEDLREIFATSSTPNGYDAARDTKSRRLIPQGSLDLSFQFGPLTTLKKASNSVEQLSSHLRQRLSKSGLSKSSSGDQATDLKPMGATARSHPDENSLLLGASQRSTGLSDLLASRAPSKGGYDSDAKSIKTPSTQKDAESFQDSPRHLRKSFRTIDPEIDCGAAEKSDIHADSNSRRGHNVPPRSQDSKHTSEAQPSTAALRTEAQDSTSDTHRRVNHGTSYETIRTLDATILNAIRPLNLKKSSKEMQLTAATPRRISSFCKTDLALNDSPEDLDRCTISDMPDDLIAKSPAQRDSLLSHLDPDLLHCFEQYAGGAILNEVDPTCSPQTITRQSASSDNGLQQNEVGDTVSVGISQVILDDMVPGAQDGQSPHLYEMRISQRLASSPRENTDFNDKSRTESLHTNSVSSQSLKPVSGSFGMNRYPKFIRVEHNRSPSDPLTKRLFESPVATHDLITIDNRRAYIYDTSSAYSESIAHFDGSSSERQPINHMATTINRHSIAIGGRSASTSQGFTARQYSEDSSQKRARTESGSLQILKTGQRVIGDFDNLSRQRSATIPISGRYARSSETPTPKCRKVVHTSDPNERMSYETVSYALTPGECSSHALSTDAEEDVRNETLSQVDVHLFQESPSLAAAGLYSELFTPPQDVHERCITQSSSSDFSSVPSSRSEPAAVNELGHCSHEAIALSAQVQHHKQDSGKSSNQDRGTCARANVERQQSKRKRRSASEHSKPSRCASSPHIRQRSRSAGDLHFITHKGAAGQSSFAKFLPLFSGQPDFLQNHPTAAGISHRLKKISLQSLARKLSSANFVDGSVKARSSDLRKTFTNRTPFLPDMCTERSRSAGFIDRFRPRKFDVSDNRTRHGDLVTAIEELWTDQSLGDTTPKCPPTTTDALNFERAKPKVDKELSKNKNGLLDRVRYLYRTGIFTSNRNSASPDSFVEGDTSAGRISDEDVSKDEGSESGRQNPKSIVLGELFETFTDLQSKPGSSASTFLPPHRDGDTREWGQIYAECVGSLSALHSDCDFDDAFEARKRFLSLTSSLRGSTLSFEAELRRQADFARTKLLRQVAGDEVGNTKKPGDVESGSGLHKMPGSFD